MTINERFSEILKTKRISVKEAASIIGKSEVYIRKLIRPDENGKRCGRSGGYRLTEIDIESSHIVPVTERMVWKFQSHVLRADRHRHRGQRVEIRPAQRRERKGKPCKKVRPHIYLLSYWN